MRRINQMRLTGGTVAGTLLFAVAGIAAAQDANGLAAARAIEAAFEKVIEQAEKSVVSIAKDKSRPSTPRIGFNAEEPFPFPQRQRGDSANVSSPDYVPSEFGAGIIIDRNGLILTNYHVVRGGPVEGKADQKSDYTLYVRLADRRGFTAQIYAADPRSDLAILRIAANNLPAFEKIGDGSKLKKGQMVIALGNPYAIARDGSASATWGIVSNVTRPAMPEGEGPDDDPRRKKTVHHLGALIQLDTRLELGTSGGALVNLNGELMGMTTSLAAIVGYEKSSGFAVPFDAAMKRVIDTLRQGREVEYGFLGIMPETLLPDEMARLPDLIPLAQRRGAFGAARINKLVRNLPAHDGQMQPGDIVLAVDGKPIFGEWDLMREVGLIEPGRSIRIRVWRELRERDLDVTLGKWPNPNADEIVAPNRRWQPWAGIVFDYGTARSQHFSSYTTDWQKGVLVLEVEPDSAAAKADIRAGDLITQVNDQLTRTPQEFEATVAGKKATALQVRPRTVSPLLPRLLQIRTP